MAISLYRHREVGMTINFVLLQINNSTKQHRSYMIQTLIITMSKIVYAAIANVEGIYAS
jgi:hypothetical protein